MAVAGSDFRLSVGFRPFGSQDFNILGVPQHFGHPAETSPLDADLLHEAVDHRGLHPIAQRGINDLVRDVAIAPATCSAVDMQDLDGVDLLHWPHALAHDTLDALEQLLPEARGS